jgi:hypothetical protein
MPFKQSVGFQEKYAVASLYGNQMRLPWHVGRYSNMSVLLTVTFSKSNQLQTGQYIFLLEPHNVLYYKISKRNPGGFYPFNVPKLLFP